MSSPKVTIIDIKKAKTLGRKITMLTAYDYPFAQLADLSGVDMILVGDSLGMAVLGLERTAAVTMEDMIHHCRAAG